MELSALTDQLTPLLASYGAAILGLILLLGAVGLPVPSTASVVLGGALSQQGLLSWPTSLTIALCCVLLGDAIGYRAGGMVGTGRWQRWRQRGAWQSAERRFLQHSPLMIYLTRCLFTPLALPVNLAAGSSGYPLRQFIKVAALGQFTWLVVFGGLGYALGSEWTAMLDSAVAWGSGALAVLALGALLRQRLSARQPTTDSQVCHDSAG